MPELPEVETTRLGIINHVIGAKLKKVDVYNSSLRWPIDVEEIKRQTEGFSFKSLIRRGKYLIFSNDNGHMICHLGMSGSFRIDNGEKPRRKHDHVQWTFKNNYFLRYHDPRRFGCVLWTNQDLDKHRLLERLGVEPLTDEFDGDYLYQASRNKSVFIKTFIMNSHVVVGVGNIYASEALFLAKIHPITPAGRVSRQRYNYLVKKIKLVLSQAIESGGTTLRDFINADGNPGYFIQALNVYSREGQQCNFCNSKIKKVVVLSRSTYYCPNCQH